MKLGQSYCGVFGDWGWEAITEDGTVEESQHVFESFDECQEDAWHHGYTVRRSTRLKPQSTPSLFIHPCFKNQSAIAA